MAEDCNVLLIYTHMPLFSLFFYQVKPFHKRLKAVDLTFYYVPTSASTKYTLKQVNSILELPLNILNYLYHSEIWPHLSSNFSG